MGTFFATHEAELYHYGRKGMRRGQHLPDVLDPKRELIGKRASTNNVALTSRLYDRYRTDKQRRDNFRSQKSMVGNYLPRKRTAEQNTQLGIRRSNETSSQKAMVGNYLPTKRNLRSAHGTKEPGRALKDSERILNSNLPTKKKGAKKIESAMSKTIQDQHKKAWGVKKSAEDYRVQTKKDVANTKRRVELRQKAEENRIKNEQRRHDEEVRSKANKQMAEKAIRESAAAKAASSIPGVGVSTKKTHANLKKLYTTYDAVGAEQRARKAVEDRKTMQGRVNNVAKAAKYLSNVEGASGAEQRARKTAEDKKFQDSRTKQLQREAHETRKNNAEIRRIRDYNARVAMPKYLSKKAQEGAAEAVRANEKRKTKASKNQFSNIPKWKQNLERAKSQKAASERATQIREQKDTDKRRRAHLEENRRSKPRTRRTTYGKY